MAIKILQCGLGPIGIQIIKYLGEKTGLHMVGAVDIDPQKIGTDLSSLVGMKKFQDIIIQEDLQSSLKKFKPHLVILTTSSSLKTIVPQLMEILSHGINVISTCEELSYPWRTHPDLSKEIDAIARENNVTVLATGVNPGFLMDFLPLAFTGICHEIKSIKVERVQNALLRRTSFQKKIGVGLTRHQFLGKVKQRLIGHIGLIESIYSIADCMDWSLDRIEKTIIPIVANHPFSTSNFIVDTGRILGVDQQCRGYQKNCEVLILIFRATIDEPNPYDHIVIQGIPKIDMTIDGGINGDVATCSIIVNAIPIVMSATAGLKTMVDIKPITYFKDLSEINSVDYLIPQC